VRRLKDELPIFMNDKATAGILKDVVNCIPKKTKVYLIGGRPRTAFYYRYFGKELPSRDYDIYVSGDAKKFISNLRENKFVYGKIRRKSHIVLKRRKFSGAREDKDKVVLDIEFRYDDPGKSISENLRERANFTINGFALPLGRIFSKKWHENTICVKTAHDDLKNKQLRVNASQTYPADLYSCIRFVNMGFKPPSKEEVDRLLLALGHMHKKRFSRNLKKVFGIAGGEGQARRIAKRMGIKEDIFSYATIKKLRKRGARSGAGTNGRHLYHNW
jgi:hypothetical protein